MSAGPAVSALGAGSVAMADTVVRFKVGGTRVEPLNVATKKKGGGRKDRSVLGPAMLVKPALAGAAALFVVQYAMHVFLKA